MADSSCLASSCADQASDMNVGAAVARERPKEWRIDSHSCQLTSEVLLDLRDGGLGAAANTPGQEPRCCKCASGNYPAKSVVTPRIKSNYQHGGLRMIEMHKSRF